MVIEAKNNVAYCQELWQVCGCLKLLSYWCYRPVDKKASSTLIEFNFINRISKFWKIFADLVYFKRY